MKKKNLKKPFFASFLEKQIQEPEKIQGGLATTPTTDLVTLPNRDSVTAPVLDNVTLQIRDNVITLKYPSDSDESGEIEIIDPF